MDYFQGSKEYRPPWGASNVLILANRLSRKNVTKFVVCLI